MKGINESYMGLSGNNSVSMAWNVLMKKVKYWIMLKMGVFWVFFKKFFNSRMFFEFCDIGSK
jgi:hypothetical protein